MPDIPSTPGEEQEQTQLVAPLALQTQVNEQSAPSDDQNENQEVIGATTILANQEEAGFQLVMFAPGQQPVELSSVAHPAVRPALIPPPITVPPLPLPDLTKPKSRISPLVKGILIAQSIMLIIGAAVLLYINVYEPARISAEATATASTAFAKSARTSVAVTNTAQVNATNTANSRATATAKSIVESTATVAAQQNIYKEATKGTPFISSPMAYDNTSANWEVLLHSDNTGCYFTGEAYHVTVNGGFYEDCLATNTNLTNFAYQMEMEIKSGNIGGIFFRVTNKSGYILYLTTIGTYKLYRGEFDTQGEWLSYADLTVARSSAIKEGLNKKNLVTVIVRDTYIHVYINGQYVTSVTDPKFKSGMIGVITSSDTASDLANVAFRNLKVWKL